MDESTCVLAVPTPAKSRRPLGSSVTGAVTTNGHTINKVQFYTGPTLLGEDASAPFGLSWNNAALGQHTLLAQVIYDGNAVMSSIPINLSVTQPLLIVPTLTGAANGANLELTLTGAVGGHYRVDSKTDLVGSWQLFADLPSLVTSPFTLSAPMTNAQQFFRTAGLP